MVKEETPQNLGIDEEKETGTEHETGLPEFKFSTKAISFFKSNLERARGFDAVAFEVYMKSLNEAVEERAAALKDLDLKNPGNIPVKEMLERELEQLGALSKLYDEPEEDRKDVLKPEESDFEPRKLEQLGTEYDFTLDFKQIKELLDEMTTANTKRKDEISAILEQSKEERGLILEMMHKNNETIYKNSKGEVFDIDQIHKDLELINRAQEEGEEYILKISEDVIAKLPQALEKALRMGNSPEFDRLFADLKAAYEEREGMLNKLQENPDLAFRYEGGQVATSISVVGVTRLLKSTLEHYTENQPNKPEQDNQEQESHAEQVLIEYYKPEAEKIKKVLEDTEKGTASKTRIERIRELVSVTKKNIQEKESELKIKFTEDHPVFAEIKNCLDELEQFEQRIKAVEEKQDADPKEAERVYVSIKNEVRDFTTRLGKNAGDAKLHTETKDFIDKHKVVVKKFLEDTSKTVDLTSPEYKSAKRDLLMLEALEEKLNRAVAEAKEAENNKMPEELIERVAVICGTIPDQVGEYTTQIEAGITEDSKADILKFIDGGRKMLEEMQKELDEFGRNTQQHKDVEASIRLLKDLRKKLPEDKKDKPEPKPKPKNKKDSKDKDDEGDASITEHEGYGIVDTDKPGEPLYIKPENYEIMKTKPRFVSRLRNAVNAHNRNIRTKQSSEVLRKSMAKVEKFVDEFNEYKKKYLEEKDAAEAAPEPTPEPAPTPEPEAELEVERLFDIDSDMADTYAEIVGNKEFDKWFKSIKASIENDGITPERESQTPKAWFEEYKESLPYQEKLSEVFADIRRGEGMDRIKLSMAEMKINDLLYGIHKHGRQGRERINEIYADFEHAKKQEDELKKLKASKELKAKILEDITKDGKSRALRPDEVEAVLKTRGKEHAEEDIEDLILFLQDMESNYNFYSKEREGSEYDIEYAYRRYKAAKGNTIKIDKEGEKSVKKLGWFRKIMPTLKASWPQTLDAVDLGNSTRLIKKLRELDLVDRKTGDSKKADENKDRMAKLIQFCGAQKGLLAEHVRNPQSKKEEVLNDEEKQLLKLFDGMIKTYSESKYRGKDARYKAAEILNKDIEGGSPETGEAESTETSIESLFEDGYEMEAIEKQATKQVYRDALTDLGVELGKFSNSKKDLEKVKQLSARFDEIRRVLEDVGDDETDLFNLKKVNIAVEDMRLRHVNKDSYEELSNAFPIWNRIIASPDIEKPKKEEYVNELLAALKKLNAKSQTTAQTSILNVMIGRYTKILKTLK